MLFEKMKTKNLEPKIVGIMSTAFTILNVLVISSIGFFTCSAKEKFLIMFEQLGRCLPFFTDFILSIPIWFYIACFAIVITFLIIKEFWLNSHSIALFINAVALVLSIVYLFIYIMFLFLPLACTFK